MPSRLRQKLRITCIDRLADFRGVGARFEQGHGDFLFDEETDTERVHDAARAHLAFAVARTPIAIDVANADEAFFPRRAAPAARDPASGLMILDAACVASLH